VQLLGVQDLVDAFGLGVDVATVGPPQRGSDLAAGQRGGPGRVGCLGQQLERVGSVKVGERLDGGGEEAPQRRAKPEPVPGAVQIRLWWLRATSLTASASSESPATGRWWWRSSRTAAWNKPGGASVDIPTGQSPARRWPLRSVHLEAVSRRAGRTLCKASAGPEPRGATRPTRVACQDEQTDRRVIFPSLSLGVCRLDPSRPRASSSTGRAADF
jgi:hypothetical protein